MVGAQTTPACQRGWCGVLLHTVESIRMHVSPAARPFSPVAGGPAVWRGRRGLQVTRPGLNDAIAQAGRQAGRSAGGLFAGPCCGPAVLAVLVGGTARRQVFAALWVVCRGPVRRRDGTRVDRGPVLGVRVRAMRSCPRVLHAPGAAASGTSARPCVFGCRCCGWAEGLLSAFGVVHIMPAGAWLPCHRQLQAARVALVWCWCACGSW